MPDFTARITEILGAHGWVEHRMACACGYGPAEFGEWNTTTEQVDAHIAPLLAQAAEEHYRPRIETVESGQK